MRTTPAPRTGAAARLPLAASALLAACAVGPATRVSTSVPPVLARNNSAPPPSARPRHHTHDRARGGGPAGGPAP